MLSVGFGNGGMDVDDEGVFMEWKFLDSGGGVEEEGEIDIFVGVLSFVKYTVLHFGCW